jgi:hypothetical protein
MTSLHIAIRLLGSIREHMTAHQIDAEINSVQVDACDGGSIAVHLTHNDLPVLAAGLLAWADTITNIVAAAWRPRYGDNLHLRITGQLPDAIWIEIWGAVTYTGTILGTELQPGGRQPLTPGDLRSWAAGDETVTP